LQNATGTLKGFWEGAREPRGYKPEDLPWNLDLLFFEGGKVNGPLTSAKANPGLPRRLGV